MHAEAPRVVCILGPTGAGKTAMSLSLAEVFSGEVVNFDSRQLYRQTPIVTAQPTPEERARCPHHLYGVLDCDESMTAARFIELAAAKVCEVAARGRMPLLVGGTGLYLDGLLHGMDAIPDIDPAVRARVALEVESRGPQAMHMRLALVDPEYAVKIHPNDRQRITRALEVFESTGRPFSSFHAGAGPHAEQPPRFDALKIGITEEREALAERMALRIEAMLEAGALEEVARAREVCAEDAPAFSAIGCGELLAHLAGRLSLEEAKAVWLKRTRDYAKRQLTWFRRDESIHWLAPQETDDALDLVREWLTRR